MAIQNENVSASLCGTLVGHNDWVTSIVCPMTGNSNKLITASRDKTIIIWELTRTIDSYGIAKRRLFGHEHIIQDLALTPDGTYLISASWDKTLRLWNLNSKDKPIVFKGHEGDVLSVSISQDNRKIVSGSRDGTIRLWNSEGQEQTFDIDKNCAHQDWVSCVRHSVGKSKDTLVSVGWDGAVKMWHDNNDGNYALLADHRLHTGYINNVMISPDGSLCATGGKDGKIMLWNLDLNNKFLYSLDAGNEINSIKFNPSRYWLAVATEASIQIWSLELKKIVKELYPETPEKNGSKMASCVSLAWSPDGSSLFSGWTDKIVRVWQVVLHS